MSKNKLEERVSSLEQEMAEVKKLLPNNHHISLPWWEKISGTFENNSAFETAMELGNEYRKTSSENETES